MQQQGNLQAYVTCLRKIVPTVADPRGCGVTNPPPGLVLPELSDFTALDLDANQVHEGQQLVVIAFVNDQAPVRFKTDMGTWFDSGTAEYLCDQGFTDPDCGPGGADPPDGVVVGRLTVGPDDRGTGHVNVIQEEPG